MADKTASGGLVYTIADVDKMTSAEVYGKALRALGDQDPDVVVLTADLNKSTKTFEFSQCHPTRFFNFGIAEQNMMAAAAGFALVGKIPFVSTFAVFASQRACEQLRTDIAYPNLKVTVVATHSGVSFGPAGTTHHCTEDLSITRSMANMTVVVPADGLETGKMVEASIDWPGPIYARIGRGFEAPFHLDPGYNFEIGRAEICREGKDLTVIACGPMVRQAVVAAEELESEGISIGVINCHTIKPIDKETILAAAARTPKIIVSEDHNIIGGLAAAVAEIVTEAGIQVKIKRLGIPDIFAAIGYPEDLYAKYGMDADGVKAAVREMLA